MKIKNHHDLNRSSLRALALDMAETGLVAIDTRHAIQRALSYHGDTLQISGQAYDLSDVDRLMVVGIGKCSLDAVSALEDLLQERITGGIVLDVREGELRRVTAYAGDHPMPSQKNVDVTSKIIESLEGLTERDLVLFIISGGGSTLLCQPEHMTSEDEMKLLKELFAKGADIQQINTVRKHLSRARGGFLAKHAHPAHVISLIFSDVPGDDIAFIASGPTVRDETTIADARGVLDQFELSDETILSNLMETPKDEDIFENVHNILFISNQTALTAMADIAKQQGYEPRVCTTCLSGESREAARRIVDELKNAPPGTVLLYGGETTVTLDREGKGGRNLELALSSVRDVEEGMLVMSFASDGRDNTDFAGGLSDVLTQKAAQEKHLDPEIFLVEHRSYHFFEEVGDKLLTGHTGSNVADLVIAIKARS